MNKPIPELLTTAQLAPLLQRRPTTILIWARNGIITAEVAGGRGSKTLFDPAKVMRQLAKQAKAKADARKPKYKLGPGMVPTF